MIYKDFKGFGYLLWLIAMLSAIVFLFFLEFKLIPVIFITGLLSAVILNNAIPDNIHRWLSQLDGIAFTFVIGKYGGFYAKFTEVDWRICFGWIAFTIYFCDLEGRLNILLKLEEEYAKKKKE